MSEQAGIYRVVLYENLDIAFTYSDNSTISGITNSGQQIEIAELENQIINFIDNQEIGNNNKLLHDYQLSFKIFDYDLTNIELIGQISSIFGYIPLIYFRNGEIKVLKTPIFIESDIDFDPIQTHYFDLLLETQQKTFQELIDYA